MNDPVRMGLFEPKWLIRLASCFMIAFSGSPWACRWVCHNYDTVSLFFFIYNFFPPYKCILTSIPLSVDGDFEDSSSRLALYFQDGFFPLLQATPSHQSFKPQCCIINSQSCAASRWLIGPCQCPVPNTHLKPRVRYEQVKWDKHTERGKQTVQMCCEFPDSADLNCETYRIHL